MTKVLEKWLEVEIAANKAGFGEYTNEAHENAATKAESYGEAYAEAAFSTLSAIIAEAPEAAVQFFAKHGVVG